MESQVTTPENEVKAVIEFIGYFRHKAGCGSLEADFTDSTASVLDLIVHAEEVLEPRGFKVLEDAELKSGVLLFVRNEKGGLDRIHDLSAELRVLGGHVIIANLMGGG